MREPLFRATTEPNQHRIIILISLKAYSYIMPNQPIINSINQLSTHAYNQCCGSFHIDMDPDARIRSVK